MQLDVILTEYFDTLVVKEDKDTGKMNEITEETPKEADTCELFDGIILLINRNVFDFFKNHNGNLEDNYDDIIAEQSVLSRNTSSNAFLLKNESNICTKNLLQQMLKIIIFLKFQIMIQESLNLSLIRNLLWIPGCLL